MMPRITTSTTSVAFTPGDKREGQIERRVGDDVAKLVEHGARGALHAVLARHHAVEALSAMRTNSVTGNSRNGQRDCGKSASQAPWARLKTSAASVTALAVTPALARASASRAEQRLEARLQIVDRWQCADPP